MTLRRLLPGLLIGVAVALSCDGGPTAGDIAVELVTPRTDVGAVLFTVTASEPETIDSVTPACTGCQVYTVRVSEREVRGAVTGTLRLGDIMFLTVSNRELYEAYTVQLLEVADTAAELISISGSQLRLPTP